jgi:hypothetical protein
MPLRACHTSFMQTSETYMITWRARAHQQCDSALLLTCQTKRGNPGTRRSPDGQAPGSIDLVRLDPQPKSAAAKLSTLPAGSPGRSRIGVLRGLRGHPAGLDRDQARALSRRRRRPGAGHAAVVRLLLHNAVRVDDLGQDCGHRVVRKGARKAQIPLTAATVVAALDA